VDAALAQHVCVFSLAGCLLSAAAAPALARLLDGGVVTKLLLCSHYMHEVLWADEAGAALLGDALRTNTSLRELQLSQFDNWWTSAAGTTLLGALTGHGSLHSLDLTGSCYTTDAQATAAVAAALGALVAADTLTELELTYSSLGDVGPLFDALPAVTRLRTLNCCDEGYDHDDLSDTFIRNRMLPALRANASLRHLELGTRMASFEKRAILREAMAVVNSRADE
jgi:hypothetical protein